MFNQSLTKLNLPPRINAPGAQVIILNACSVVRKVFSDDQYLANKEPENP